MTKEKKVLIIVIGIIITILTIAGIIKVSNTLNGTYVSESKVYEIKFMRNGDCYWFEDDTFFTGTYKKVNDMYAIHISGSGFYISTNFIAKRDGIRSLVITGGTVDHERFIRKK